MIYLSPRPVACNESALLRRLHDVSLNFAASTAPQLRVYGHNVCTTVYTQICNEFLGDGCANTITGTPEETILEHTRPSHLEIWCFGLLAVCMVCSCAAFGLCLFPIIKKDIFQHILTWMIGLAVGCLSGIAIFHLIPQCYELPSESPEHIEAYLHKSVAIMGAIYFFYVSERVFRLAVEYRKQKQERRVLMREASHITERSALSGGTDPPSPISPVPNGFRRPSGAIHVHDAFQPTESQEEEAMKSDMHDLAGNGYAHGKDVENPYVLSNGYGHATGHKENPHLHMHGHTCDKDQPIQTVAWMILTGDGIHKFVDGLSIGAAFSVSLLKGVSISLAVMCEELPHELGDFAILLNSGLNLKRAVLYNCLSGLPCFLGFAVGVFLGELPTASSWIFALAGGMFIYISYVNMLPEMTTAVEMASQHSIREGVKVFVIQNFGLLFGLMLMYLLARYSERISIEQ